MNFTKAVKSWDNDEVENFLDVINERTVKYHIGEALITAIKSRNRRIFNKLMETGADSNYRSKKNSEPVLHLAIKKPDFLNHNFSNSMAVKLYEAGADLESENKFGETAIFVALDTGNVEFVNLIFHKVNIFHLTKNNDNILYYVSFVDNLPHILDYLLDNFFFDVNHVNNQGKNVLHPSAKSVVLEPLSCEVTTKLLLQGYPVTIKDKEGQLPSIECWCPIEVSMQCPLLRILIVLRNINYLLFVEITENILSLTKEKLNYCISLLENEINLEISLFKSSKVSYWNNFNMFQFFGLKRTEYLKAVNNSELKIASRNLIENCPLFAPFLEKILDKSEHRDKNYKKSVYLLKRSTGQNLCEIALQKIFFYFSNHELQHIGKWDKNVFFGEE